MAAIVHPLLTLLASLTRQELARQVTYLKAENQILRSKLPKRIELSNQERRRLVKHGKSLGARIKELISIVSYSTFRKWDQIFKDAMTTTAAIDRLVHHSVIIELNVPSYRVETAKQAASRERSRPESGTD